MPQLDDDLHHEWIRWLSGPDAQVLLMHLCQEIEEETITREALVTLVERWRTNALRAVGADNWRAQVDRYLEVWVDARLYLFRRQ